MTGPKTTDLPDIFRLEDGRSLRTPADWPKRRRELFDLVVGIEYGGLPPTPSGVTDEPLHTHKARRVLVVGAGRPALTGRRRDGGHQGTRQATGNSAPEYASVEKLRSGSLPKNFQSAKSSSASQSSSPCACPPPSRQ